MILKNSKKKKILILGSNIETLPLVKKAQEKNLITFVVGKEKKIITKQIADFPILGDAANFNFVNSIVKRNRIDAVMIGTVDVLIKNYEEICRKNKLPCFANKKSVNAFSSKFNFSKICKKFGFKVIPDYTHYFKKKKTLPEKLFPVIVKPVDSGGGAGTTICNSNYQIYDAIKNAKNLSKTNSFLCQEYFLGDDIQLYFTIVNKEVFLSSVNDRCTSRNQNAPVCIGTNYNSKYLSLIKKKYHSKFQKMINYLRINNGILSIQCFMKNNELYPYDPGFRLQGEGNHLILNKINKFDHLDMLLDLSIGKPFYNGDFKKINDPYLKNNYVSSVWILLKKGTINRINNLEKIKNHKCFIDITQRFKLKDKVKSSFLGTEKQVFARIYLASKKKAELIKAIRYIHKNLQILDMNNKDLILDKYIRPE
jgi:hypothetical protein